MKLNELPDFINFSEEIDVAQKGKMDKAYVRSNNFLAICGVKKLLDFARFTSHEDMSIDRLEFMDTERLYLTGLKRRAVLRRASEGILRDFSEETEYTCATPDHQCMTCYNCYMYGGLRTTKPTKGLRSRIKPVTAFSFQSYQDAVTSEPEFHIMVHRNLSMEQKEKSASIYEVDLIKPGTVFPFVDVIFNPSKFDLAMYFETLKRADAEGYGSRSSLYGTMNSEISAVYKNWAPNQEIMLKSVEAGVITAPEDAELLDVDPAALRNELAGMIRKIRSEYGDASLFGSSEK